MDSQKRFTMEVQGIPTEDYLVEATTNFVEWTLLATNRMPTNAVWVFVDEDSVSMPCRFYRAHLEP